ncbi:MAG TPA: hypothetical protein VFA26_04395 [Gemmataceae bacterium]|nr:hypothetical protein [Gemmataceae bacterium]
MRISRWGKPVRLLGLVALAALVGVAGCARPTGTVSGKVYYKDKPLKGGNVTLVSATGQTFTEAIQEDGSYTVSKVPTGQAKVAVETESLKAVQFGGGGNYPLPDEDPKSYKPPDPKEMARRYVQIPEKYADPNNSGLTVNVSSGPQSHDIKLQ